MAFVKLDTGILDSTLWFERDCRELFITALLMAEPREFEEPTAEIATRDTTPTGWIVPPGWYGFIKAAGPGIVNRALLRADLGMAALEKLSRPDPESRSKGFEGRRLVRVDGGFIVLNYMKYREKDHTAAERSRRYRERKFAIKNADNPQASTQEAPRRDEAWRDTANIAETRNVTQAEAEAEAEAVKPNQETTPATVIRTTENCRPSAGVASLQHIGPNLQQTVDSLRAAAAAGTDDFDRAGELFAVLKANSCKGTPSHPLIVEWARRGVTQDRLRQAIAKARESNDGQLNPAYLDPILDRIESGAQTSGKAQAWATDEGACEAKARELGLWPARAGESWNDLRSRIRTTLTLRAQENIR